MSEQIPIFSAPITYPATSAGAEAAKCVLKLEDLLVGYGPLPDEFRIRRFVISNEGGLDYPAGCAGNVSVGIDPGRRYITPSRFPAVERVQPRHPKLCGILQMYPGKPKAIVEHFDPPLVYRKGIDRIIVAPNMYVDSTHVAMIYLKWYGESVGDWPLDPNNVYLNDIVESSGATPAPAHTYRTVVGPSHGGAKVRVHNTAHKHGAEILSQFVGVQASPGSPATINPSVPLLLDGLGHKLMPPWTGHWREADLITLPGQRLVVITTVNGAWGFTDEGGGPTWWENGSGGSGYQATRTHSFDCVQVR